MMSDQVNADVATFVRKGWPVYQAVDVTATANENVTIFLPNDEAKIRYSTTGNLHHETCHLIIERPSLEKRIQEWVKEAICDAYKFLKMHQNDVATYEDEDREWFAKMDHFLNHSIKLILSTSGDKAHEIIHGIPASRILRRLDTLDQLRSQILVGFSAKDIVDPDVSFPEILYSSWNLWKSMDGKSEDERWRIKQQIEHELSIKMGLPMAEHDC